MVGNGFSVTLVAFDTNVCTSILTIIVFMCDGFASDSGSDSQVKKQVAGEYKIG